MVAEHGNFVKKSPTGKWVKSAETDIGWISRVRPVLNDFLKNAPGSFIEEKDEGIAWHYRMVKNGVGEKWADSLHEKLSIMLKNDKVNILRGKKVLEIVSSETDKGTVVKKLVALENPDFILAFGDDVTDEAMFKQLPKSAFTVKVGSGKSLAHFWVKNVAEVRRFLGELAQINLMEENTERFPETTYQSIH